MANFIKRGIEFNKLAQSFNGMYLMTLDLESRLQQNMNNLDRFKGDVKETILVLAYIAHNGVVKRMEKYNWELEHLITIPMISSKRITIGFAWSQTITKMTMMAGILGLSDIIQEVYDEGPIYQALEKNIPSKFKNW